MKKIIILSTIIAAVFFTAAPFFPANENPANMPVPTEYQEHKQRRKEFKKHRKEYMEEMHKSHPDVDWREIDAETRRQKWLDKTEKREQLRANGITRQNDLPAVRVGNRDITGYWTEKGSNNLAGRMLTTEIDYENELIYCASSGGNIWRGSLLGENWESLTDYYQIKGMRMLRLVDIPEGQRLLMGTSGKKFYYTDDQGFTIHESTGLVNLQNWGNTIRTVVKNDEQQTIYLLAKEWDYAAWQEIHTLHRSIDSGESFELIQVLTDIMSGSFDLWTPRYETGEVYLQNDNNFYTIDFEGNPNLVGSVATGSSGSNLLTGGVEGGIPFLYARIGSDIYYSEDGANSWEYRGVAPGGTFMSNSFNCSNINPQLIYIGGMELYRSFNGGNSWELVNNWWDYYGQEATQLHADIPEVRFFVDPTSGEESAYISTDGGLYVSYDNIQTVQNLSLNGLGVSQYYSTYTKRSSPHLVYAGSQDQGYQRSFNDDPGVLDFDQIISGDYGHLVSGDGGESIWCDYPGFVLYYPDAVNGSNGHMWDFAGSGYLWIAPLTIDPEDPEVCYIGGGGTGGGNHITRLTFTGSSISAQQLLFDFAGTISAIEISPIDPSHWYVLTSDGRFYHSTNSGGLWLQSTDFEGPDSHYFYGSGIHASSTELGTVYIGGSGYSNPAVFVTHDHGLSFSALTEGLPPTLVYELEGNQDESILFAATEVGPYAYLPDEELWYDLADVNAPDQTYWTVDYIPELGTARFGTYGRGIWDFSLENYYWITPGDVNQDSDINIMDLVLIVNIIMENIDPTDEMSLAADVNEDEIVNVQDIVSIVNLILNI